MADFNFLPYDNLGASRPIIMAGVAGSKPTIIPIAGAKLGSYLIPSAASLGCTVTLIGAGLNDLAVSNDSNNYDLTIPRTFYVRVVSTDTPNRVSWSLDGATYWSDAIEMSTDPVHLGHGLYVYWGATVGHTGGDVWKIEMPALMVHQWMPQHQGGFATVVYDEVDVSPGHADRGEGYFSANVNVGMWTPSKRAQRIHCLNVFRNGLYGYGGWRSLGYHSNNPILRILKQQNAVFYGAGESLDDVLNELCYEPPVMVADKPLLFEVMPLGAEGQAVVPVKITSEFGGEIAAFANRILDERKQVSKRVPRSAQTVSTLFQAGAEAVAKAVLKTREVVFNGNPKQIVREQDDIVAVRNGGNGKYRVSKISYSETVYPKRANNGFNDVRRREHYEERGEGYPDYDNFNRRAYQQYWRDSEESRTRESGFALNSQNEVQSGATLEALSAWPLDTTVSDVDSYREVCLRETGVTVGDMLLNAFNAANLTDHYNTTVGTDSRTLPGPIWYIWVDLGRDVAVAKISIRSAGVLPVTLSVYYSDDDVTYIDTGLDFNLVGGLNDGYLDVGAHRYWRVRWDAANAVPVNIYELLFFETTACVESGISGELHPYRYESITDLVGPTIPAVHWNTRQNGLTFSDQGNSRYLRQFLDFTMAALPSPEPALGTYEDPRFRPIQAIQVQSGKRPWYDGYDEYYDKDVSWVAEDHAHLSEFRISDFVPFYIDKGLTGLLNDVFLSQSDGVTETGKYNTGFLTLHGAAYDSSDNAGELNVEFFAKQVFSDFLRHYATLKQQQKEFAKPIGLNFELSVLKKAIPYMGFYPVTRVMQIAALFYDCYAQYLDSIRPTGEAVTDTRAALQTFLHYLLSPGVLLNAIKSGIAVRMPAFTGSGAVYNSRYTNAPDWYNVDRVLKYATTTIGAIAGGVQPTLSMFTPANSSVEFESLLDVKGQMLTRREPIKQDGYDLDTSVYYDPQPVYNSTMINVANTTMTTAPATLALNGVLVLQDGVIPKPLFEMANHNFLAETVKLFLAQEGLQSFVSKPETEFKAMEHGTVYYMDVVLRNKGVAMCEGYQWETAMHDVPGNALLKQRGMLFGPAFNSTGSQSYAAGSAYQNGFDLRDPMYGAYTPPYFYGDSVVRISFAPHEADTTMRPGESRKFTLDEILKAAKIRTINKTNLGGINKSDLMILLVNYDIYSLYPSYDNDISDHNGFFNTIDWSKYVLPGFDSLALTRAQRTKVFPLGETDVLNAAILYQGMMRIDASVNLWDRKRYSQMSYSKQNPGAGGIAQITMAEGITSDTDSWVIAPKWNCPVLDVSGHGYDTYCSMPHSSALSPEQIRRARSIWYDYALIPEAGRGLYLELRESFPDRVYDKHPYADLQDAIVGNTNLNTFKEYSGQDGRMKHTLNGELFGSLIDVCGFKTGEKRLGEVAEKRTIHEGVVVIPFVQREGKVQFFPVDGEIYQKQLDNKFQHGYAWELQNGLKLKDTSITKTYDAMSRFVLPPQFDYRNFSSVQPFAMYVFDVPFELTQQDLADIWQNVMPESFQRVERETLQIGHALEEYEFFHGAALPDDIRFMLFRVKQRATWNYYEITPDTNDDKKFKFQILNEKGEYVESEPKLSYNWPYDFLSIVEQAKLDVSVDFEGL